MIEAEPLTFFVERLPDGSWSAWAFGACIHTMADTLDELRQEITDATSCHFDEGCCPCRVRLRFVEVVREETLDGLPT